MKTIEQYKTEIEKALCSDISKFEQLYNEFIEEYENTENFETYLFEINEIIETEFLDDLSDYSSQEDATIFVNKYESFLNDERFEYLIDENSKEIGNLLSKGMKHEPKGILIDWINTIEEIKSKLITKINTKNNFFENISIVKYFSIENTTIENLAEKQEVYFVGENGVGKTILLQAILMSLRKNDFDNVLVKSNDTNENSYYPNVFAYGVGRFRTHDYEIDKTGYGTLFDRQNVNLKNPVQWLKDIDRLELKKLAKLQLDDVINMFTDILNNEKPYNIEIKADKENFIFNEQGTTVNFSELADGYRSVLVILSDLLMRLSENQPDVSDIKNFKGIILIDEIDMLLHPKWEYKIVRQLRDKLPNIQWFFTTHSPMLIMGASNDAVFYKLYKENGISKISEQWSSKDITNLMANGLITSPLFDMETASMSSLKNIEKLDTSRNFWQGKINKKIKEQVNKEKAQGKVYFSIKEIDDIVEWAINEIKEEGEKND